MISAVLFDLDGTLVDSAEVASQAFCSAYRSVVGRGEPPLATFRGLSGMPLEMILDQMSLPRAMIGPFRAVSRREVHRLTVFAGIPDVLSLLHNAEIPIGVITGKDRVRTLEVLKLLDLEETCAVITTPNDPPAPKPLPDGVVWSCAQIGVSVSDTLVVGDSVADVRAGNAAGATTVACLWGKCDPTALRIAQPRHLVGTPIELCEVLAELLAEAGPTGPQRRPSRIAC